MFSTPQGKTIKSARTLCVSSVRLGGTDCVFLRQYLHKEDDDFLQQKDEYYMGWCYIRGYDKTYIYIRTIASKKKKKIIIPHRAEEDQHTTKKSEIKRRGYCLIMMAF